MVPGEIPRKGYLHAACMNQTGRQRSGKGNPPSEAGAPPIADYLPGGCRMSAQVRASSRYVDLADSPVEHDHQLADRDHGQDQPAFRVQGRRLMLGRRCGIAVDYCGGPFWAWLMTTPC